MSEYSEIGSVYALAEERIHTTSKNLHEVFNGDANTQVLAENGYVPSVRKALVDSFYFKDPIDWSQGSRETLFNQPRRFTNPQNKADVTFWYAAAATQSNPVLMTSSPFTSPDWQPWISGYDNGKGQLLWTRVDNTSKVLKIPFAFSIVNMLFINGCWQDPATAYTVDKKNKQIVLASDIDIDDSVFVLFGLTGGIVPSLIGQMESLLEQTQQAANELTTALSDIADLKLRVAALEAA